MGCAFAYLSWNSYTRRSSRLSTGQSSGFPSVHVPSIKTVLRVHIERNLSVLQYLCCFSMCSVLCWRRSCASFTAGSYCCPELGSFFCFEHLASIDPIGDHTSQVWSISFHFPPLNAHCAHFFPLHLHAMSPSPPCRVYPRWCTHSTSSFSVMSRVPSTGPRHSTQVCFVLCGWVVSLLVGLLHSGTWVHVHHHTSPIPPHVPLAQARPRPSPPDEGATAPHLPSPPDEGGATASGDRPPSGVSPREKGCNCKGGCGARLSTTCASAFRASRRVAKHVKPSQQGCKARA